MPKIRVKGFQAKLDCLLNSGLQPTIGTQDKLAKALGVSAPTITTWKNNSLDEGDNFQLDVTYVEKFSDLFKIEAKAFSDLKYEEFKRHIERVKFGHRPSPFKELLDKAKEAIQIFRIVRTDRGIVECPDEDDFHGQSFLIDEKIQIWIHGKLGWSCILLQQEPDETISCLLPSKKYPEMIRLKENQLIPEGPNSYKMVGPEGQYWCVALLTKQPFGLAQYQGLWDDPSLRGIVLGKIVDHLGDLPKDSWEAYCIPFVVVKQASA